MQRMLDARNAAGERVLDHERFVYSVPAMLAENRSELKGENQVMAESDHQIQHRREVTERQEDRQRSVNRGASGESKAQLLKQIDAAEKLLEAIKTFKRASDSTAY
jgi:hypothetical protein